LCVNNSYKITSVLLNKLPIFGFVCFVLGIIRNDGSSFLEQVEDISGDPFCREIKILIYSLQLIFHLRKHLFGGLLGKKSWPSCMLSK
jgi:hypothetical protein